MPDLSDIGNVVRSLVAAASIVAAAFGFGRPIWRLLAMPGHDRLASLVHSLLIGFSVAAVLLAIGGVWGVLHTPAVLLLTMCGLLFAFVEIACTLAHLRVRGGLPHRTRLGDAKGARHEKIAYGAATIVLGVGLIAALTPPVGDELLTGAWDVPQAVLQGGTFWNIDDGGLHIPTLPQIWSVWGLALDGPVTANLVHWELGVTLAMGTVLLARRWMSREAAWLAGGLVLLAMLPIQRSGIPHAELSGGLMTLGVALALVEARSRSDAFAMWYLFAMLVMFVLNAPRGSEAAFRGLLPLHPLLLVGAGCCLVGGEKRARVLAFGALAGLLVSALIAGGKFYASILPAAAIGAAAGANVLVRLPSLERRGLIGVVSLMFLVQMVESGLTIAPRLAVACGCQSRESYLLAASGSYRAATVFNRVRLPEQRLMSTVPGCLYFASATVAADASEVDASANEAQLIAEAQRRGCEFLLLTQAGPSQSGERAGSAIAGSVESGASNGEKFAGAVEVIPIVEYEFADEYQRTTRYRLWKLQGRRAAASQVLESASSGEEVSSRPRSLAR